ncbi:helix-turn-helix domain-containing protein [Alkalihalophilus pseudofirmus]|uniref:MarR family transcriptional regulator n=1 Tax=Alkalihalophilus pseudofirmus TaxID=79885 RepID=UPI00259B82F3|nr:helix-turn-helix domain-containing protein [Alkalihalophilus pseudofirmus]WEG18535.1 helix-turn-helix domain-containing protein [Alkalihalophilus pseudofirmus]
MYTINNIDKSILTAIQMHTQEEAAKSVIDTLDSMGVNTENLGVSLYIQDKSKVKWKTKTHFVKIFSGELKRLRRNNIIDYESLGLLTELSAYMDFQGCYLRNDDGSYMSQKDIINLTGWARSKVSNVLTDLIKKELLLFTTQKEDKRKKRYFLNPNLFYIGNEIHKDIKNYYTHKDKEEL